MNQRQRIVLVITLLVAVVAGLYPPWDVQFSPYSEHAATRFQFLLKDVPNGTVAFRLLLIEWLTIGFAGAALIFSLAKRKSTEL